MKLVFGMYEGSHILPMGKVLDSIVSYLERSLNLTGKTEEIITGEEIIRFIKTDSVLKENVDMIMIPYTINGGWDYKYYKYTSTIVTGETVIWAGEPLRYIETSFSRFYVFNTTVTVAIALALISVCLVGSLIQSMPSKNLKTRTTALIYGKNVVYHIWIYFLSFFRVAILVKLKRDSYRILLAFWLIMVIILSINQSCYFTAQMSFSTYRIIEEFEDIKYYEEAVPKVLQNSIMDILYTKKVRTWNLHWKKRYYELEDIVGTNFLEDINSGKQIIIINDFYINTIAYLLLDFPDPNPNLRYKFQISPSQGPILQGFLMSSNLSSSLMENISTRMAIIFGSKPFNYVFNSGELNLFSNTWQRPDKVDEPLKFRDMYIGFRAIIIGQALSVLIALVETFMKLKA